MMDQRSVESQEADRQWREAAHSLGLEAFDEPLLPQALKAPLAQQLREAMEQEDYATALDLGWVLVYGDPTDRDSTLDFALCLQHLGETESAVRFYGTALLLDPSDPYCIFRLGECLETLGQAEEACEAYRSAIELSWADAAFEEIRQHAQARLEAVERGEG
jgi:tetratricopeptide (TPR) repeat protein